MVTRAPVGPPRPTRDGAPVRGPARPGPGRGTPRRQGRRRFGDPRGLTVAGAVTLVLLLGAAAVALDVLLGGGLGLLFALAFAAACGLAALTVHREHLRAAVVMPPLLYLALALFAGAVDGPAQAGLLQRQAVQLTGALVYQAPVLFAATGVAAVAALVRRLASRT